MTKNKGAIVTEENGIGGFFSNVVRGIGDILTTPQARAAELNNRKRQIGNTIAELNIILGSASSVEQGNQAAKDLLVRNKLVSREDINQFDFTKTIERNLAGSMTAGQAADVAQGIPGGLDVKVPFGPGGKGEITRAATKNVFREIADPVTGEQINALINPDTGKIVKKFGAIEEGLSDKDKVTVAVAQSKEFLSDPRIKNLQVIERSERGMAAALKQATGPDVKSRIAADQALGVLFQKMLDPESVVRESEYARTPEGAAAINRLLAIAPQLRLGGLKLLDEDRHALVTMAKKLLDEAKVTANKAFDEFETRADTIGLNKKIVFGGAKRFDISSQEEQVPVQQVPVQQIPVQQAGQQPIITATNPQTGERIQSSDGGQTWQPIQ